MAVLETSPSQAGEATPVEAAVDHSRTKYRADIQGLRALAIIPVLLFHANNRWLSGGFIGVDVFFVISGFLITGIIAGELDARKFTVAGFYRRRVRRLFPALYTMLAASFVAALALLPPHDLKEFAATAVSVVFFASNIEFARLSDYFHSAAELKPLLHTWSLAVEEQFYIVFPPLLMLMWKRWRKWVPLALVLIAVASVISGWAADHVGYPQLAFYLAPPRVFELATGALLALGGLKPPKRQIVRDILSWIGLAVIVGGAMFLTARSPFPAYGLAPCLGAALIIYAGEGGTSAAGRTLGWGPLTFIGTLSYSLYLWHWPFLAFGRYYFMGDLTQLQAVGLLAASIVTAALCWRFIEEPFLRGRIRVKRVLAWGALPMALACGAAVALLASDGFASRYPPQALRLFASTGDYNHRRDACHSGSFEPIPYDRSCTYGAPGASPSVAIWGDSHGAELVQAIGERMEPLGGSALQLTASSCPPAVGLDRGGRSYCRAHNDDVLKRLTTDARIRTVFLVADYASYNQTSAAEFRRGFAASARALAAAGKRVVIVYPIPTMDAEPPEILGLRAAHGADPASWGLPRAEYDEKGGAAIPFLDRVRGETGAAALHPERLLCDRRLCRAYEAGWGSLYFNQTHLSVTGARLVARAIPQDWLKP